MDKKNGTLGNFVKPLFFVALLLSVTLAISTVSALESSPEGRMVPLQMSGSVEMLPVQPGQQMPPKNGAPPQSDGTQPPNQSDSNGMAPVQPENGAPPQQFGGSMPPPPFPTDATNASAFGAVRVDVKTWRILIGESLILAFGIAFASLYKKERS